MVSLPCLGLLLGLVLGAQDPSFSVAAGSAEVRTSGLRSVERMAQAALERLAPVFGDLEVAPFEIIVHRHASSVPEDVLDAVHEDAAGVALLTTAEVHLLLDRVDLHPPGDVRTVIAHELAHILLHQFAGEAGPSVPRWFHEGLAQHLAGATYLGVSEEEIVFDALADRLMFFSRLRRRFPEKGHALRRAYAQSFSFVSFLARRVGLAVLLDAARQCRPDRTFYEAYALVTGEQLVVAESDWVEYVKTGSGARFRILLTSCFGLTMAAMLPVLVLAGRRRWNRDARSREKLTEQERAESTDGEGPSR